MAAFTWCRVKSLFNLLTHSTCVLSIQDSISIWRQTSARSNSASLAKGSGHVRVWGAARAGKMLLLSLLQSDWDVQIPFPGPKIVSIFTRPLFPRKGWGLGTRLTRRVLEYSYVRALERARVEGAFYTRVQCQSPHETLHRYSRVLVKLPVIGTVSIISYNSQYCTLQLVDILLQSCLEYD